MKQATHRSRLGMSLIEIMIVVSIIGLLATLAVPSFRKARHRAMDARFINDLRILTDTVFEQYAIEQGDYPPDSATGVAPPEVVDYLSIRVDWSDGAPIGGEWDWDRGASRADKVNGVYAGLSVIGASRTSVEMREIDELIDDGNLLTGTFRQISGGYMFVLEE